MWRSIRALPLLTLRAFQLLQQRNTESEGHARPSMFNYRPYNT